MKIKNSGKDDIEAIFRLYRIATQYQKIKLAAPWPEFEKKLIEKEISEKRQWKIIMNEQIACVWATTFDDSHIWEERNADPSLYIHRIVTDPDFRGKNLVLEIVNWAKTYAKANNKAFIRMDTVGENTGLINYYTKCGFNFLGLHTLKNTSELPAHYHNAAVSLFEIPLS